MARDGNIEDTIISDIESNTGDNFDAGTDGGTTIEHGGDGGVHSAEPDNNGRRQTPDDKSQRGDRGDTRGKRDENGKAKLGKDGKPEQQKPRHDGKGNIVDEQGNVVAAKGVERRLHYTNERLKAHNGDLSKQVSQLQQQLQQTQSLGGLPAQHGLDNNDVPEALRIAGVMKRDPAQGARMALEYAIAQGVDLRQIVTGQGIENISMGAQRRMMEEYSRPQREAQARQQHQEQVQRDVNRFTANYPAAVEHQEDISRLMPEIIARGRAEGRNIDAYTAAEMALHNLQNFAMSKGLDPNRRIQDQIDEIRQRQPQQQNGQQRQIQQRQDVRSSQPRPQAPMPNGSRGANQVPSRGGSLPATTSTDAIVRQAMADSGYRFGN